MWHVPDDFIIVSWEYLKSKEFFGIDSLLLYKLKLSMNILLLGGTRFFGIHTVNELLKNGHKGKVKRKEEAPEDKISTGALLENDESVILNRAAFRAKV